MTATSSASQGLQHWHLPAMRAVPALLVGLPVPFIQLHSPLVGLIALAVLLAGSAVALWIGRRLVPGPAGSCATASRTFAALAMSLSSVSVVANALRLRAVRL